MKLIIGLIGAYFDRPKGVLLSVLCKNETQLTFCCDYVKSKPLKVAYIKNNHLPVLLSIQSLAYDNFL